MKNELIVSAALILLIMAISVNLSYAIGEEIQQQRQVMPAGMPYQNARAIATAQQINIDAKDAAEQSISRTAQAAPGANSAAPTAGAKSTTINNAVAAQGNNSAPNNATPQNRAVTAQATAANNAAAPAPGTQSNATNTTIEIPPIVIPPTPIMPVPIFIPPISIEPLTTDAYQGCHIFIGDLLITIYLPNYYDVSPALDIHIDGLPPIVIPVTPPCPLPPPGPPDPNTIPII